MQPHGSDRVREREDGAIVLSCRLPKEGWQPRVPKTLTRSEHPGTAILWEDAYYEIIEMEVVANGVRYTLAPWSDAHTMRVSDAYDAESELLREAARRDVTRRNQGRKAATLLGFLTGHLPAAIQEQLAHETGINPPLLTMVSAIPEMLPAAWLIHRFVGARLGQSPPLAIPLPIVFLFLYMSLDATVRFGFAWLNSRPLGSVFGIIGYAIYYAFSRKKADRIAPLAAPRGEGTMMAEVPADVQLRDSVKVREHLITLLPRDEQQRIAARFAYDHRRIAPGVAYVILFLAILGTVSSWNNLRVGGGFGALVTLASAVYLVVEQIVRLTQFGDHPAGSILGYVVRPLTRKFLV